MRLQIACVVALSLLTVEAFEVNIDFSEAPECEAFATKSESIVREWAPKIQEILYGENVPIKKKEVFITFRPMKGVAHASGNKIVVSAEWVTKKAPNDYGMIIHELVHVLQDYQGGGVFWVTEGIADYIRYERFEPGKQKWKLQPGKSSYKQGYGIAGAFLAWLEKNKEPELIRKLNAACKEKRYKPVLFEEWCGKPLDDLWQDYVDARAHL